MIEIKKSNERGSADHGWLKAKYSFSFADYQDPHNVRFRSLRVLNEDIIAPGKGFGMHPHANMEIITYLIDGELLHEDSLGNSGVIRKGEIQKITAGSGIQHSERNPSEENSTHLLQIWIMPDKKNLDPSYEQTTVNLSSSAKALQLIASSDARENTMQINQNLDLYAAKMAAGDRLSHAILPERYGWLQIAKGEVELNGNPLSQGDAAKVTHESLLELAAIEDSELLFFDLA